MALSPRKLLPTLCWCVPTALLCAMPGAGFFMILAAPVAVPALVWSGIQAWRRPAERPWRAARAGMVLATFLVPMALHQHYRVTARRAADATVGVLERFRQGHGRYPLTMAEAGLVRGSEWRLRYGFPDGQPVLYYPDSFDLFDKYFYDFDRHRWRFFPD